MKPRRIIRPAAVGCLVFLCFLLAACGALGGIPLAIHNRTGADLSASISVSQRGQATTLLNGYVLGDGSDAEVSVPRSASGADWHIYIVDGRGDGYTFCDLPAELLGDSADITIRYEGSTLVLDVDWGNDNFSTLYPAASAEVQAREFWLRVQRGEATYEDYYAQDFWLRLTGGNFRKRLLIFGSEDGQRYATQAEAAQHMTRITIPVWKLSNGAKVSSTASLYVHSALADEVVQIFTEIYNDPEQFPIKDIGGYSWRGDTSTSEHNIGTAIDINYNENFQIRYGNVVVGSFWDPDASPYSIPEDGSVVRIFAAHGWAWGGDAWAGYTDYSTGNHDYMHFSYFGG